jgi:hypothetical protein
MSQDGEPITAMPDDQVVLEAAVKIPSCISEALFYLFLVYVLHLFSTAPFYTRKGLLL